VRDARGFTLVELLIVLVILAILMAISMANYRYARMQAAETAAIGAMVAINEAQFTYMQTCGNQRFAPHLATLGKPSPGSNAPFLSPDLTGGADDLVKSGYRIQMAGTEVADPIQTCTGDTPLTGYQVTSDPMMPGWSGRRFFGTNVDLVIYENTESFTGKMPESGPPDVGQEVRGRPGR
jgi:prepilin-type N-terminal cleavage/methylation domain-containing protein